MVAKLDYSSGFKPCSKCKQSLPLNCFYRVGTSDRLRSMCKECSKLQERANPNRHWTKRNWHNSPRGKDWKRKVSFLKSGVSESRYLELLNLQGGGCAICGETPREGRRLAVDHDHLCCDGPSCGRCVRGLLCDGCNVTLGRVKDSRERLLAMIRYLDGYDCVVREGLTTNS